MRKLLTLEVWVDETIEDAEKCAKEIVQQAQGHEYCCDGTVEVKEVIEI